MTGIAYNRTRSRYVTQSTWHRVANLHNPHNKHENTNAGARAPDS